jgi:hypothetical protein
MAPAQVLKDFNALFLGQVNIQNNQGRRGGGFVAVRVVEEARGRFAIFHNVDPGLQSRSCDRFPNEENVRRVIFDDQNMRITGRRPWITGW